MDILDGRRAKGRESKRIKACFRFLSVHPFQDAVVPNFGKSLDVNYYLPTLLVSCILSIASISSLCVRVHTYTDGAIKCRGLEDEEAASRWPGRSNERSSRAEFEHEIPLHDHRFSD